MHQQDNDDRFCTRGRKCARTRNASSQPNDVIELSSGSEGEDECIMSNSTSSVSGSATAAAKLVSTSLDSTQYHHDFAGDIRLLDFGGTSQSGGMTSGRSGHTRTSSMSGVASATATSSSVTSSSVLHGSVEDHEQERSSAGDMCSRMSTSRTTSPCSPSTALAKELAHGHSQRYVSKVDTAKDLEIAKGMAKNDQHDILDKLSSESTRKRSLTSKVKRLLPLPSGFASGGPPISPSIALAKELAHGCNQVYPSKEDTSKDLVFAKGMAKDDDQHDIFDTLSSVKSKRSLSLFSAPSSSRAKKSKVKINSSSHLGLGTSPEVWDQAVRNFLSASSKSFTERSSYYDGSNVGSHHAGEYL